MTNSSACIECEGSISPNKKWGYRTLCGECDTPESVSKSVALLIVDGKTDYYFQIINNPTEQVAAQVKSHGFSHDPRTQLKSIRKVSS